MVADVNLHEAISIHALREEGDILKGKITINLTISIHALREEGDAAKVWTVAHNLDFYPRPPRGGRHVAVHRGNAVGVISIHALREEGDSKNRDKISIFK